MHALPAAFRAQGDTSFYLQARITYPVALLGS